MVTRIQDGASRAVSSMEAGVSKVSDGVELAHQAGNSITAIRVSANHVVLAIDDISSALDKQSDSAQSIASNIERIARMSDENNTSAAQTVTLSHKIKNISSELGITVDQFKV